MLFKFFEDISYMHLVPQIIRSPDLAINPGLPDAYGSHFLERIAKTPERTRNTRLKRILEALQIAVPQLKELKLEKDDRGVPHLIGVYEHWRAKGAKQNEDQFSDGTLRLLGLLWSLLEGNGPLLLEEPELSLHPIALICCLMRELVVRRYLCFPQTQKGHRLTLRLI